MKKAKHASEVSRLEQIPNIGASIAKDLRALGITKPQQLKDEDGIALYMKLEKVMGKRHDPCVADTMMAAVDFMKGGKPKMWWEFSQKRKKLLK